MDCVITYSIKYSSWWIYIAYRSTMFQILFLSSGHCLPILSVRSISFCQVTDFRMLSERARSAPPALAAGPSNQVTLIGDGAIAIHSSSAPNTPPADHNPPAPATLPAPPVPTVLSAPPAPVAPSIVVSGLPVSLATAATALPSSQPISRRIARARWTEPEARALEDAVKTCLRSASRSGGDDQGLWTRVENYMRNVKGYDRTATAYRIKYGRGHRAPTGVDERNQKRVRSHQLQTSVQKSKKRSSSKKDKKGGPDEDANNPPPKKKARKQLPAQSSSARNTPASTSSMTYPLPANILRPPSNYPYAITPHDAFMPTNRVPTANPLITYSETLGIPSVPGVYDHRITPPVAREPGNNITSSSLGVPNFPASEFYSAPDAFNFGFDNSLIPNPRNNAQPLDRRFSSFPNELYRTPFASNFAIGNSSIHDSANNTQTPGPKISSFQNSDHHWTHDAFNFVNSSVPDYANNTQITGPRDSSFRNPERYDAFSFTNSLVPDSVNNTPTPVSRDSNLWNPERYDAFNFTNSLVPNPVNNTPIAHSRDSSLWNPERYDAFSLTNSSVPGSVNNTQTPGSRDSNFWNPERYDAFNFTNSLVPDSINNTQITGSRDPSFRNLERYDTFNFEFGDSSDPEPAGHIPPLGIGVSRIPASQPHSIPNDISLRPSNSSIPEPANNIPTFDLGASNSSNLEFNNLSVPGLSNNLNNLNSEEPNSQRPEQPPIPGTPPQLAGHPNELNQTESTQISLDGAPRNDVFGFLNDSLDPWAQQNSLPSPPPHEWLPSDEDWYDGLFP